ncbi:hypothetical protein M8J76_000423 [Diaphorina citri]|nr:hypothetical protein M8J76_000423 [Diaphorina citri]
MQAWCTKLSLSLPMSSGDNTTTRSTIMFESEFIPIKRGIFQGDGWSPMWFCLSLNPLSNILNNTNKGYKLQTSSMFNISHLLYVDDLKIYARNNDELQSLLETTAIFSSDINMQFGIEKCATLEVKRGNIVHQENIELALTPFKFPSLESFYKYLGMSQDLVLNKSEAKEKVKNAYASRMKKILTTELNGQNKIKAINSWCVPILSYSFGIIPWTKTDLQALDRQTRVLMTQHRIHHPRSCMERLYLPRAMGGQSRAQPQVPRQQFNFMEPSEQTPVVMDKPKDPPREKMINTAVAFLKLPQVQASPLKGKQEFLRSKGLTDEEVRISCEIAGAFNDQNAFMFDMSNSYASMKQEPRRLWWPVIRDIANVASIAVVIFVVSHAFYQKYLYKYFNGNKKDRKSVRDSQNDMLVELKSDMIEKFVFVQSKLSELDTKISKMVQNQESQDLENHLNNKQIDELRAEVLSLKGLLLNRKQFPMPNTLATTAPSIPSWQLKHDSPKSTGSAHQDSIESSELHKHTSDHSEGSDPEIITKDNGSNGSDSSLEIVK